MITQESETIITNDTTRSYITRLRFQVIAPITITIFTAVTVIAAYAYLHEQRSLDNEVIYLQTTSADLYQSSILNNVKALRTVMDVIKTDPELRSALMKRDRRSLLLQTASLYEDIHRHYGITHFYFTDPDRINLLRVHKPEKFGDTIDRRTTMLAYQGGMDAYGVELGPLGTLTLRYVQPWYDLQTQRLIGFVELGMEVDETIRTIHDLFGLDIYVLIYKKNLNKIGWEDGMRTFGRVPEWDRFPNMVVSVHGMQKLPESLNATLNEMNSSERIPGFKIVSGRNEERAIFQPIKDISGETVGLLVMFVDISNKVEQSKKSILLGTIALVAAAGVLIVFFYWFIGRIGSRMASNEIKLQQMATHDGLTGLYNHRAFHAMLEDALALSERYGRVTSLLLLDIDHFKDVNDSYGHLAGDAILKALAQLLLHQARITDRVCRYGGEEIAILLPETGPEAACAIAERLREVIADRTWETGDEGNPITISVSIGIASCPLHAVTPRALISAADNALYLAKETGRNRVSIFKKG